MRRSSRRALLSMRGTDSAALRTETDTVLALTGMRTSGGLVRFMVDGRRSLGLTWPYRWNHLWLHDGTNFGTNGARCHAARLRAEPVRAKQRPARSPPAVPHLATGYPRLGLARPIEVAAHASAGESPGHRAQHGCACL